MVIYEIASSAVASSQRQKQMLCKALGLLMALPAASWGVSKASRNEAIFGEKKKTDALKGRTIRNTTPSWPIYLTMTGVFCSQLAVQLD